MPRTTVKPAVRKAMRLEAAPHCLPRLGKTPLQADFFIEGDELYARMAQSIRQAKRSIRLEYYMFAPDEIGWYFAKLLVAKAAEGIPVWVHLDAAGSFFWHAGGLGRYLRRHGIHMRWFHRWSWREPLRYNRRNHRKMLIIDGNELYLGGYNIHRANSYTVVGPKRWRDTHLRTTGTLAHEAADLFDHFWRGGHYWEPQPTHYDSMLVPNHTRNCRHTLRCLYTEYIAAAQDYVYLTTPYFVPDLITQQSLIKAAGRGVDVRLLLPHKSDVLLTQWAARAAYASLLNAGVRIYEYLPRVLHAKTAVIDGNWGTVGTANLDYRSLYLNYELNFVTHSAPLCTELERQFLADLQEAEEVLPSRWAARHWISYVTEGLGWCARRWL